MISQVSVTEFALNNKHVWGVSPFNFLIEQNMVFRLILNLQRDKITSKLVWNCLTFFWQRPNCLLEITSDFFRRFLPGLYNIIYVHKRLNRRTYCFAILSD